jgi:hypothetical protein
LMLASIVCIFILFFMAATLRGQVLPPHCDAAIFQRLVRAANQWFAI